KFILFAKHLVEITDEASLRLSEIGPIHGVVARRHGRTQDQRTSCDQHCLAHALKIDNPTSLGVRADYPAGVTSTVDPVGIRPRRRLTFSLFRSALRASGCHRNDKSCIGVLVSLA